MWAELIDFGCRAGGRWATRKAARHPSCRHWPPTPGAGGTPGEAEELARCMQLLIAPARLGSALHAPFRVRSARSGLRPSLKARFG